MKFLLLILFIGVFGMMIITSLLRGVSSFLFGKNSASSRSQTNYQKQAKTNSDHQTSPSKTKKLFSKDEGEYVTYEEIKE